MSKKWHRRRKRLLEILEVGNDLDHVSRAYDFLSAFAIVLNLAASIMYTYDNLQAQYGSTLLLVERITVAFFAIDFVLRLLTAGVLYEDEKDMTELRALRRYIFSFMGIIDLLSFLPYYLPIFFPSGTVAFRMIRIVRIFRLFRINAYYDSLHVITEVIYGKRSQLVSSVVIIMILMIGSSLCMYSLEHEAQPDVFQNAFSGVWWAASTLLTVGYGDIYPVTTLGKVFGIFITFLGVGMVAIPTGIISAGFVDQYTSIKKRTEYGYEADMNFIKVRVEANDVWADKRIADLDLPANVIISVIKRGDDFLIPNGGAQLEAGDLIVLGAEPFNEHENIQMKEVVLKEEHPWVNKNIKDLDISRHSVIVLVKRRNKALIPNGNMKLLKNDRVFLHTQMHLQDAKYMEV